MKREVYEALKTRITVTIQYQYWHWEFNPEGLNDGISCFDDAWIDEMCQNVTMKKLNMWNIAQRVYSFLVGFHRDNIEWLDAKLIANPLSK